MRAWWLGLFVLWSASAFAGALDPAAHVLPKPKIISAFAGEKSISLEQGLQLPISIAPEDQFTADLLKSEIKTGGTGALPVRFTRVQDWSAPDQQLGDEGYILEIRAGGVNLTAKTARGLFYAAQTLLQLQDTENGLKVLPALTIRDWPDVKDRMILYDLRFNTMNLEYTKRWIRELSRMKVNQFMIFLSGDYMYRKYPFFSTPDKLTPEKLAALREYARQHHVELVPHLEALGHAEGVLSHEEFREMRLGPGNTYAYSPCTEKTYGLLNDLIGELVEGFDQTDLFHVGGDEIWGFSNDKRCKERLAAVGEPGIYAQHFQRLHAMVSGMNRRMAMWGDMMLEKPESANGIPRDTIIFDWHYDQWENFASLKFFKNLGFKNIFAAPAVWGHWDVYPQFPMTFRNIPGFTREALAEDIRSVCVTIWEMHYGGNAENYLYGAAFAGDTMWNSGTQTLAEYNRRFAAFWFGIRQPAAAAQVDRVFWMPWRTSGSSQIMDNQPAGYWQEQFFAGRTLYAKFAEFSKERGDQQLTRMVNERAWLERNLDQAARARDWLLRRSPRNRETLEANETAALLYRHVGRKSLRLANLALGYRRARAASDRTGAATALARGRRTVRELQADFPAIEAHLRRAIDERNSTPRELEWLREVRQSAADLLIQLADREKKIRAGGEIEEWL